LRGNQSRIWLARLPTEHDNKLYHGDNLDVLHRYVKGESVDLGCLEVPFNSRQDYILLFAEKDGMRSTAA
jgi:hypothetical protein